MAIGLVTYLAGLSGASRRTCRAERRNRRRRDAAREPGFARGAGRASIVLFVPSALFWAAYEQQGNT